MKFRNLIAAAAVLAVPTFFAGTARADTFTVDFSVWAGATSFTTMTTPFAIPGGTPSTTGYLNNSTSGVINFYSGNDEELGAPTATPTSFLTDAYNPNGVYNGDSGAYLTGGDQLCGHTPAPGETCGINNDVMNFNGETYLEQNATYSITHDDGMYLYIGGSTGASSDGTLVINSGDPTAADTSTFTWTGPSGLNTFSLWYAEVNGAPAVLYAPDLAVTPEPSSLLLLGTGLFGLAFLLFRRKTVKPVASPTTMSA